MIVTRENFKTVVEHLSRKGLFSFDTETTGLRPYQGDKLFSLIIAHDGHETPYSYYFNFQHYDGLDENKILPREWLPELKAVFAHPESYWFAHNAKFDMAILANEGIEIVGEVHCTEAQERVVYNAHFGNKPYSLHSCAQRIGLVKDDAVEEYIKKHKLFELEKIPGKKLPIKKKHFHRVPFEIIHPYGEQDAIVTLKLGIHQLEKILEKSRAQAEGKPQVVRVHENEKKLTKTCYKIEKAGVKIDLEYCKEAIAFEEKKIEEAKKEFREIFGEELIDSNKELARLFTKVGETYPETEKGNPSFTEDVLRTFKSEYAVPLLNFRKHSKRANTYFKNYLHFADAQGVIHSGLRQSGTETGRFSSGDPNLQNVPKRNEDQAEFPVRRAFIPREGFKFVMFDMDQVEYRLMMDYAGQLDIIEKINNGLDVHTATMELMEMTDREPAKTINFMKLYGGGVDKLSESLGITKEKAQDLSNKYWQALPKVKEFIYGVSRTAKVRGYIFNWFGRICHFPDPEFSYAAPNHLIQGGVADIIKIAMNEIDHFLEGKKSRMILQVHDEIVVELHNDELAIVPTIKDIIESAYPAKRLKLTCGVECSDISWFDKKEWS